MSKEWKGNSDSVRSRLAINKAHTTKGREQSDFYATDPAALEALLDHPSIFLETIFGACIKSYKWRRVGGKISICLFGRYKYTEPMILECACGTGNLSEVLRKRDLGVFSTDYKDRGYVRQRETIDFLQIHQRWCMTRGIGVILTNPPYSLANEFILHALEILPEGGVYIALMNISYLAGQKRYKEIYRYGTLREVYVFSKRVECWRNNNKEEFGGKAMVDFAWYVFQKGYAGQPTLYWL